MHNLLQGKSVTVEVGFDPSGGGSDWNPKCPDLSILKGLGFLKLESIKIDGISTEYRFQAEQNVLNHRVAVDTYIEYDHLMKDFINREPFASWVGYHVARLWIEDIEKHTLNYDSQNLLLSAKEMISFVAKHIEQKMASEESELNRRLKRLRNDRKHLRLATSFFASPNADIMQFSAPTLPRMASKEEDL